MPRAHLLQSDIRWEDRPANYRLVDDMLDAHAAALAPGDLLVLPEMFDTGFSFNLARTADTDGSTLAFLRDLARRRRLFVQGARTAIGPDGRGRNRCPVFDPAGVLLCEYDKVHPFSYGRETEFFSGGEHVRVYTWDGSPHWPGHTVVCPSICYDLRFPELYRQGLALGAEVLALGANWPASRAHHRRSLGIARAIENQAYLLCVNRAGQDPHLTYSGGTFAVDPKGQLLAELGPEPGVLSVEIDLPALRAWRKDFPAWRDRRLA